MPATPGQTVMTLRNATGATVVALCIFYDPATRLLRDGTYQTVQDGTKTGALVADNTTSQAITVVLSNDALGHPRTVNVPAHGRALTAAQLAALPAPITTVDDLNGTTFQMA